MFQKKVILYKILKFPYLIAEPDGKIRTKKHIPESNKRLWQSAVSQIKQDISKYKSDWKEEKIAVEDRIKLVKKHYIDTDSKDYELEELRKDLVKLKARQVKPRFFPFKSK